MYEYDSNQPTPYVTDDDLADAMIATSHQLAGRAVVRAEQAYKDVWLNLTATHPSVGVAARMAACGSLALLRRLARHEHVYVRWAATHNRFAIDADVQLALAADAEEEVVIALITNVDPGMETCKVIAAGPHARAKRNLARRNLCDELLEILARDRDRSTARAARRRLALRHPAPTLIATAVAA